MSTQRHPIPLFPYPPLPPPAESASSDFPPTREAKRTPDPPASVPNRYHPRSPVTQRYSKQNSSPSEEPAPRLRRHAPKSVAQKRSKQRSLSKQEPGPSHLQRNLPNSGLGNQNRLNTMHSKNFFKSSSKRDADALEVEDERPFKKKRISSTGEDDMYWLKREISDIKECVEGMAEFLIENTEYRLEELRLDIRELS